MTFKSAVNQTLPDQWQVGLGALRSRDRERVQPEAPRRLQGSVEIDTALRGGVHAQANRWDYAIGFQHSDRKGAVIYWLEMHTASDGEVKVVLRKLEWLRAWLRGDGSALAGFEAWFVWVPSGATTFTRGSPQMKMLAQRGLHYAGSVFRIPIARG